MSNKIQKRVDELKQEFESGQKMMMELDSKRENLRETLLRISGAIQVLEEQLGEGDLPGISEEDSGQKEDKKSPQSLEALPVNSKQQRNA